MAGVGSRWYCSVCIARAENIVLSLSHFHSDKRLGYAPMINAALEVIHHSQSRIHESAGR